MLILFASIAFAAIDDPSPEKKLWYDCLEAYSQIAMLSTKSTATIAFDALAVCSDERKAFQIKLLRAPTIDKATDGPAFAARLADEDRAAAVHTIAFLNQNRRR